MAQALTRKQVAERLGVAPLTIYRWEKSGKSPARPQRLVRNGRLIYSEADVQALQTWMNATVEPAFGQEGVAA